MAKGKRAAALFEVIQAAKAREEKRLSKAQRAQVKSGGLRTPSWWFKSKKQNTVQAANSEPIVSVEIPPTAPPPVKVPTPARPGLIASLLSRSKSAEKSAKESQLFDAQEESIEPTSEETEQTASEQTPAEPAKPMMRLADDMIDNEEALDFGEGVQDVGEQQASSSVEAPESNEVEDEESVEASESSESTESIEASEPSAPATAEIEEAPAAAPQHKPVSVAVNRQRQQLDFHVSYTSAAIGAFGFIVVVAMAFLIGKSFSHGPAAAGAASIASIRKGPAFPQVLEVNRNSNTPVADDGSTIKAPPKTEIKNPAPTPIPAGNKITPTSPQPAQQPPAKPPVYNGKRIVGMQYVWIRSYPDPEDANDAVAVLKKAGIDATAEKGLWVAPTWTSVVGTRAFDHARNNPDFDAYLRSIQEASDAFVGSTRCKVIGWKDQQQ